MDHIGLTNDDKELGSSIYLWTSQSLFNSVSGVAFRATYYGSSSSGSNNLVQAAYFLTIGYPIRCIQN
ncbi:MAG: hypothetical protein N4A45_12850 [Flavobacteriales bacterium]|nr:hypothetical protein [Flavobacteriales bacterium]